MDKRNDILQETVKHYLTFHEKYHTCYEKIINKLTAETEIIEKLQAIKNILHLD
jgi:hypothetical protein